MSKGIPVFVHSSTFTVNLWVLVKVFITFRPNLVAAICGHGLVVLLLQQSCISQLAAFLVVVQTCIAWCTCTVADQHQKGNIFTLFLHSPLMAFCHIVNIVDVPVTLWDKCLSVVDKFIADASRLLSRSRTLGTCLVSSCTVASEFLISSPFTISHEQRDIFYAKCFRWLSGVKREH